MLTGHEGVCAFVGCSWFGLAGSFLTIDAASIQCSVRSVFRDTSIRCVPSDVCLSIVCSKSSSVELLVQLWESVCFIQHLYTSRISAHRAIPRQRCFLEADSKAFLSLGSLLCFSEQSRVRCSRVPRPALPDNSPAASRGPAHIVEGPGRQISWISMDAIVMPQARPMLAPSESRQPARNSVVTIWLVSIPSF